jgi:cytoskeletal protein RodZ
LPKNEDGEFELVLGNKQLLSMFFVVVVLLGVFFVMGYIVGRNSAPLIATEIPHKPEAKPPAADSPAPKPAPEAEATPAKTAPPPAEKPAEKATEPAPSAPITQAAPAKTAPAKETPAPTAKTETAKSEPPPKKEPKAAEKTEPAKQAKAAPPAGGQSPGGQPLPGAIYLQLSATDKTDADKMVDVLRKNSFPALDKEVPEKAGLFRVLVGPVPASDVNKTRTELDGKGFPGTGALKKTF